MAEAAAVLWAEEAEAEEAAVWAEEAEAEEAGDGLPVRRVRLGQDARRAGPAEAAE